MSRWGTSEERMRFPILGSNVTIAWSFVGPHQAQAFINHGQSLDRLAERGGLSWSEVHAVVTNSMYTRMPEKEAEEKVLDLIKNRGE